MTTTRLSSKGQVIIPKALRSRHHWEPGQELVAVETDEGVLLKPRSPFPEKTLKEIAGSLHYKGPARTLEDMEEAVRQGAERMARDRR